MASPDSAKSDTETESTEEEIEPKFKYKRIGNDLKTILNTDVVTCSAVHPKFLIFGTSLGRVYLLDHQGNSVVSNLNYGQHSESAHTVAVNHVDVDQRGEYVATCSDDGKVNITGLFSNENNQNLHYGKYIKAVALDPDAKSMPGKRFIVGDDKLTMYEKTFLKKLKANQLSAAEGHVLSVCWNGAFVAWASCLGVRIYDLNEKCSLGLMKWEEPTNALLANYRCNFRWSDATTLLIGWVDTIRICVIRKRNSIEAQSRDLPGFIVDPISTFQTTYLICGLAPLNNNTLKSKQLVVLGYPKEKDADRKALRPVLCVVEYKLNSSMEICKDSLSLRGYQEYSVNDYSLGCIIDEFRYFIVAPKDIVEASPYGTDDRINWLIAHGKYKEAIDVITVHGGSLNVNDVVKLHINNLFMLKQYDEAAKECWLRFGNDCALWKDEVYKFVQCRQLRAVSAYLPTTEDCKLEPQVYEMVLYEYLQYDARSFLNLVKKWPPYLYDCKAVINAITGKFRKQDANELLEALARLYLYQQDYENALRIFLKLKNKDVFDLIRRYHLYGVIHKMIIPLIELERDLAFEILLDGRKIPSEIVVQQLEQNQMYLYWYLDALEAVDKRGTFHSKLVELYARFEPAKLLPFLRRSKHYDMKEALSICKNKLFYPEMVYLLGQMGSSTEALHIIMHQVNDIEMAIDFCKKGVDPDLWNILINESIENPQIMTKLFDGIVGYVNPEAVINKIKPGQKIPELRKSLVKMLWDYRLRLKIQQSSIKLLMADYYATHADVVRKQQRGLLVSNATCCEVCHCVIIIKNSSLPSYDIVVYGCGHIYHEKCLQTNVVKCAVCAVQDDDECE